MGLKKLTEKVSDYNERLERGKANKIKPGDYTIEPGLTPAPAVVRRCH